MTLPQISRRVALGTAWTVPVLVSCAPAPAFAASGLACRPFARCKRPGDTRDKSYVVEPNCASSGGAITAVEVRDKFEEWIAAEFEAGTGWVAPGFGDSRRDRLVRIADASGQQQTYMVSFSPC